MLSYKIRKQKERMYTAIL